MEVQLVRDREQVDELHVHAQRALVKIVVGGWRDGGEPTEKNRIGNRRGARHRRAAAHTPDAHARGHVFRELIAAADVPQKSGADVLVHLETPDFSEAGKGSAAPKRSFLRLTAGADGDVRTGLRL